MSEQGSAQPEPRSDEGTRTERQMLIDRASVIWRRTVDPKGRGLVEAFSDWGGPENLEVWRMVGVAHTQALTQLIGSTTAGQAAGGGDTAEQLGWLVRVMAELRTICSAVQLMDTGEVSVASVSGLSEIGSVHPPAGTGTGDGPGVSDGPDGDGPTAVLPIDHAGRVAEVMAARRQDAAIAASGGRVQAMADKSASSALVLKVRTDSVEPTTGRCVGMSGGQIRDLDEALDTMVKVDRVDAPLMDLAQAHVGHLLDQARVRLTQPVSRPAVVGAALALVLRGAGVSGIRLNDEGEMLCELLGSGGDLERGATIDARLEVLGNRLDRIDRRGRLMEQRLINAEKAALMESMVTTFALAEQVRRVRVPVNAESDQALEAFDLAAPGAVSLYEHLHRQVEAEWRRRIAAQGRPSAELADIRREHQEAQARIDQLE